MICLDKADEASPRRLAWSQSPPALAPAHTTRQDLNGIANLREFVAAGQHHPRPDVGGAPHGLSPCDEHHRPLPAAPAPAPAPAADAGRHWQPLSSRLKAAGGGDDQGRRLVPAPSSPCLDRLWSWSAWLLSVFVCAYALSALRPSLWTGHGPSHAVAEASAPQTSTPAALHLRARRSTCAAGGVDPDEYNMPLHAGALVIIWFVSTLGCAFPIMATKFPGLRIPRRFFFTVRHFGTGVLIATAFVHLLPTAFVSLGNPCLGRFWTADYEAMPGAIALAAIFLVVVIEMVFHPSRHIPPPPIVSAPAGHVCSGTAMLPFGDMGPLRGRSSSVAHGLSQLSQATQDGGNVGGRDGQSKPEPGHDSAELVREQQQKQQSPEMMRRKERLQCILLEMGILFHSVFIGMALSVSVGSDFVVLLIAIVFHQTFEGLALGSRIAAIEWEAKTWQPWAMALAYGCTTPIGQAIGLATHTLYSPDSEVGLILVGVMNAISAGLLTFASLVELLSEDFLSDESWRHLRGSLRIVACLLVFLGAFSMSLVGAWA